MNFNTAAYHTPISHNTAGIALHGVQSHSKSCRPYRAYPAKRLCRHPSYAPSAPFSDSAPYLIQTTNCSFFGGQSLCRYSTFHLLRGAVDPAKAHRFFDCIDVPESSVVHRASALYNHPAFVLFVMIFQKPLSQLISIARWQQILTFHFFILTTFDLQTYLPLLYHRTLQNIRTGTAV